MLSAIIKVPPGQSSSQTVLLLIGIPSGPRHRSTLARVFRSEIELPERAAQDVPTGCDGVCSADGVLNCDAPQTASWPGPAGNVGYSIVLVAE